MAFVHMSEREDEPLLDSCYNSRDLDNYCDVFILPVFVQKLCLIRAVGS